MHRSHEHLEIAIEICDGLLIHQVLGALKPVDIPADIRVAAIDALVENYFVPGTAIQAGYPIEMVMLDRGRHYCTRYLDKILVAHTLL